MELQQFINLIKTVVAQTPAAAGGLDDTLAIAQALSADRIVELNGKTLILRAGAGAELLTLNSKLDGSGYALLESPYKSGSVKVDDGFNGLILTSNQPATLNSLPIATVNPADDYPDDAAAAAGGVAPNHFYHSSGVVKINLSS